MNKIEFIVAIRHASWVSYQMGAFQPSNEEMVKDQEESLTNAVEFMLANPDVTSEDNHKNWCAKKISQGWVYGKVKDFDLKTHPNLIDYYKLPYIEMAKDVASIAAHKFALKLWNTLNIEGDDINPDTDNENE